MSRESVLAKRSVRAPRRPRRAGLVAILAGLIPLLVAGAAVLSRTVSPPFSSVYDNSDPSWVQVSAFEGGTLVLADGRRLRPVLDAGTGRPAPSAWTELSVWDPVFAETAPAAAAGQTDVTLWGSWITCGNGTQTWNPLARDMPRYRTQIRFTAVSAKDEDGSIQ